MLFLSFCLIHIDTSAGAWERKLTSNDKPRFRDSTAHQGLPLKIASRLALKGSFTIFLLSVRTHILDSNEVWYS